MQNQWNTAITVAALVERDGRFLLVEENTAAGRALNQPAGHLEPGESLKDAVIRETLEETGWSIKVEACVGVYQWWRSDRNTTVIRFAYAATTLSHDTAATLDEDIIDTHWLTLPELRRQEIPLRSPLVLRSIEDYNEGRRFPLDVIQHIVPEDVSGHHRD